MRTQQNHLCWVKKSKNNSKTKKIMNYGNEHGIGNPILYGQSTYCKIVNDQALRSVVHGCAAICIRIKFYFHTNHERISDYQMLI